MNKILSTFILFASLSLNIYADVTEDKLVISNADKLTYNPGSSIDEDTQFITIGFEGTKTYTGAQMDIYVPGYEFVSVDGEIAFLNETTVYPKTRGKVSHALSSKVQKDGYLRISISDNNNKDFVATSGELLDFYVKATSWAKPGKTEVLVKNIKLIPANGSSTVIDNCTITSNNVEASTACTLAIPAGWSTCVFPFTPSLPDGVKVYDVNSLDTENSTVQLATANPIGDYKPYVVYADAAATLTGTITASYPTSVTTNGMLNGVVTATEITSANDYVLQTLSGTTGFYQVDPAKPITVPMGKCYLEAESGAKVYTFEIEQPTAIQNIETSANGESVYSINGLKVSNPHHGVYIKGGKKVVIK